MKSLARIEESEFISLAKSERCSACLGERSDAISPTYLKYVVRTDEFMSKNVYPTWRTNKSRTVYIGSFETPPIEAFPVTYDELALLPELFDAIHFDKGKDYLATRNVIAFHCTSCGIRVVKDGNHRLLQCVVQKMVPEMTVYEVASNDWQRCTVGMKNFCKCFSKNRFHGAASLTRRRP